MRKSMTILFAVSLLAITSQAQAAPKNFRSGSTDVAAMPAYGISGADHVGVSRHYRGRAIWDRISIPTPSGTWRVAKSCGQRLSAYWGLGSGLDSTRAWLGTFARAATPGPRVALYTPGHVMGVVGGREGAWRVVSFNGDGRHGNVEFTINSLRGYTLLDTTSRISSTISAKRHYSHNRKKIRLARR